MGSTPLLAPPTSTARLNTPKVNPRHGPSNRCRSRRIRADRFLPFRSSPPAHASGRVDATGSLAGVERDYSHYICEERVERVLCGLDYWLGQDIAYERCELRGVAGYEART